MGAAASAAAERRVTSSNRTDGNATANGEGADAARAGVLERANSSKNPSSTQRANSSSQFWSTKGGSSAENRTNGHSSSRNGTGERPASSDGFKNEETVNILFELIPYYKKGDESTDAIVRAAIQNLAPHEIDSCDPHGNTLLLVAAQYVIEEFVRILLLKGADPNCVNHAGACALHFSCYRETQSKVITEMLLSAGADPNVAETTYGCTPLHYSAGNGDVGFCHLLLEKGADVSACDNYNYTCVDYAREAGLDEVADFLEQKLLDLITSRPMPVHGSIYTPTDDTAAYHLPRLMSLNSVDEVVSLPGTADEEVGLVSPAVRRQAQSQSLNLTAQSPVKATITRIDTADSDMQIEAVEPFVDDQPGLERESSRLNTTASQRSLRSPVSGRMTAKHSMAKMPTESMQVELMQKAITDQRAKHENELAEERKLHANQLAEKQGQIAKLEAELQRNALEMERLKASFEEDKSQLSQRLKHYEEVEQRLLQQIEALQTEVDAAKAELAGVIAKNESLTVSLEGLKTHFESTSSERADFERKEAEERAKKEQDRQQQHQLEMAELRAKLAAELQAVKADAEAKKQQLQVPWCSSMCRDVMSALGSDDKFASCAGESGQGRCAAQSRARAVTQGGSRGARSAD